MTVYGLVSSVIWALVAVLFMGRLSGIAHRWLSIADPTEREEATKPVLVPDDLMGLAMGESEKWAQDSVLETIRERYDKLKDWNKVRAAVGVGTTN